MKRGLYSLILMFALCLSASNALAYDMVKFKEVMTKGKIIHATGERQLHFFTVIYRGDMYNCETLSQKGNCKIVTDSVVMTKGKIIHATGERQLHFFTVIYRGDIFNCETFSKKVNCTKVTDYSNNLN